MRAELTEWRDGSREGRFSLWDKESFQDVWRRWMCGLACLLFKG